MNFILSFCDISIPPEPVITIVTFESLISLYILTKTSLKAFFTSEKCLLYSLYTILLELSKTTVLIVTDPISIPI